MRSEKRRIGAPSMAVDAKDARQEQEASSAGVSQGRDMRRGTDQIRRTKE
jgi:hypothetical protein